MAPDTLRKESTSVKLNRIADLTGTYLEIVGGDHHKDQDCHFVVHTDLAYGMHPVFYGYHSGYLRDWVGPSRASYGEAVDDLYEYILSAIDEARQDYCPECRSFEGDCLCESS